MTVGLADYYPSFGTAFDDAGDQAWSSSSPRSHSPVHSESDWMSTGTVNTYGDALSDMSTFPCDSSTIASEEYIPHGEASSMPERGENLHGDIRNTFKTDSGVGVMPEREDDGPIDDSDDEAAAPPKRKGMYEFPPTIEQVKAAHEDIKNILRPRRSTGRGFKDPALGKVMKERLEGMKLFCFNYLDMVAKGRPSVWMAASLQTAKSLDHGPYLAKKLREWTRGFISDREELPQHNYGAFGRSLIDDEDFAEEIHLHLQGLGTKYIKAEDVVRYLDNADLLARLSRTKTISLATAHRWMKKMGYRWTRVPGGLYEDGHGRSDVVYYRDKIFIPAMTVIEKMMRKWGKDENGKE